MTSSDSQRRGAAVWIVAALLLLPVLLMIVSAVVAARPDILRHLASTVLLSLFAESGAVIACAVPASLLIGGVPGWLLHSYRLPFSRTLEFLQLVPLVLPAYVTAGLYLGAFPSSGFWESRYALGLEIGAATAPFAFLFVRAAMRRISAACDETADAMAASTAKRFWRLHLPLLSPALVVASCLTIAEALGEYPAAARLDVRTMSVGIYDFWFGYSDRSIALALVLLMLLAAVALSAVPVAGLSRSPLHTAGGNGASKRVRAARRPVSRFTGSALALFCAFLLVPGSLLPLGLTIVWASEGAGRIKLVNLWTDLLSSLITSGLVVFSTLLISSVFILMPRKSEAIRVARNLSWVSVLNLATPPLALGVLAFVLSAERSPVSSVMQSVLNSRAGIIGTVALRLLPFVLLPVMDALSRIPSSFEETSSSLGVAYKRYLWRVRIPQLLPVLKMGAILVFVGALNDVTLSKLLQPFGYSALSLRFFSFADIHEVKLAAVWTFITFLVAFRPLLGLRNSLDH